MNQVNIYKKDEWYHMISNLETSVSSFNRNYLKYVKNRDRLAKLRLNEIFNIVKLLDNLRINYLYKMNKTYREYEKIKEFFKKECGLKEEDILISHAIHNIIVTNINWLKNLANINKDIYYKSIEPFLVTLYVDYTKDLEDRLLSIKLKYIKYRLKELGNTDEDLKRYQTNFKSETLYAIKNRVVDECYIELTQSSRDMDKPEIVSIYKERSKNGEINWETMKKKFNLSDFIHPVPAIYSICFLGWVTFKDSDVWIKREVRSDGVVCWVENPIKPQLKK